MKTHLKVKLVKRVPMTISGQKQWPHHLRHKVHRYVFRSHPEGAVSVPVQQLNNQKAIADWVWQHGGEGDWYLQAICPSKHARTGVTWKTLVRVQLEADPTNEFRYTVLEWDDDPSRGRRLFRYRKMLGYQDTI